MTTKTERQQKCKIVSKNLVYLRSLKFPGYGGSKKCADALGIKQQQWSPWEKGQKLPSEDSLEKIAALFEVPLEYLTTDQSPPTPQQAETQTQTSGEVDDSMTAQTSKTAPPKKTTIVDKNPLAMISFGNVENLQAILRLRISVEGLEFIS